MSSVAASVFPAPAPASPDNSVATLFSPSALLLSPIGMTDLGSGHGASSLSTEIHTLPSSTGRPKVKLDEINGQLDRTKKALGDDLRADQSSGEKAHLSEILDNLSSMHLSTSFLMMVDEFEEKLAGAAAKAKVAIPPVNGTMMILGLLDVIDSGSSQPSQFETLLTKLGLDKNVWTEIFTLQGIKEILRTMPDRIYDSIRGLAKLQEAAQSVLESAILREEAAAPAA